VRLGRIRTGNLSGHLARQDYRDYGSGGGNGGGNGDDELGLFSSFTTSVDAETNDHIDIDIPRNSQAPARVLKPPTESW
jgi:hypothetical protein